MEVSVEGNDGIHGNVTIWKEPATFTAELRNKKIQCLITKNLSDVKKLNIDTLIWMSHDRWMSLIKEMMVPVVTHLCDKECF